MQDQWRIGDEQDRQWLYSLYSQTMRPFVEPTWGWDEEIQSKGFDEQLGAENFKIISIEGEEAGGYCLKLRDDCLWLDMLLLHPSHQGHGIGQRLMDHIHAYADAKKLPVRLCSIKVNPSTDFYKHLGYIEYKQDESLSFLERSS